MNSIPAKSVDALIIEFEDKLQDMIFDFTQDCNFAVISGADAGYHLMALSQKITLYKQQMEEARRLEKQIN